MWSLWRAALYGLIVGTVANLVSPEGHLFISWLLSGEFEPELVVITQSIVGPLIFVFVAWIHNRLQKKPGVPAL